MDHAHADVIPTMAPADVILTMLMAGVISHDPRWKACLLDAEEDPQASSHLF